MVWSVDLDFCYDAQSLYPGDNYVDWVGLNVYENIDENKKLNLMFKQFDFLYKNYAYKKPMFINLAISHFGSPSYEYNINDKINELDRFFNKMPNKYKRLKMINYINYDTFKANTKNKQNYLVTDNKKILESYTKLLNSDMFLYTVNFSNTNKEVLDQHKTDSIVYKIDDTFFVDENFLVNNNIENIIAATSIGQSKSFSNAIDITITASGIAKNINKTFIIYFNPFILPLEAMYREFFFPLFFIYIMNVYSFCY